MSKSKTTNGAPLQAPPILKLRDNFVDRYISTPLMFWDDGEWETNFAKETILTGKIIGIKMVKNWKKGAVAVVWYKLYGDEDDSTCEIKIEITRNILLSTNFKYNKDLLFNEDSESASTTPESSTNNSSSRSSRETA